MLMNRILVILYTIITFIQQRVPHKKWVLLLIVLLYFLSRLTEKSPAHSPIKKILINKMATTTKYDGISLQPTQVTELWTDDDFECVGWKRSRSCFKDEIDESTEKKLKNDQAILLETPEPITTTPRPSEPEFLNCSEKIHKEMAGYCIVRNRTSGELLQLMVSTCETLASGHYTCNMARNFTDFTVHSTRYEHAPTSRSLVLTSALLSAASIQEVDASFSTSAYDKGIIMIIYEKILPSAYATIRLLRLHGCKLPVELWFRPDEMSLDNPIVHELITNYNVRMRPIFDARAKGFHVKPFAVYYSAFTSVLLLDADNLPARDPTYLFHDAEFIRTGAIFWPDYWQPQNSLFELTNTSLLWQITGINYVDMFEQESGQVLINRIKSKKALDKLMFYSTYEPRLLEQLHLIWGDKDLFRLAWLNTSTPFHFVQQPPAVGGLDLSDKGIFCGLAMIQHDVQGDLIFFHRNSIKLTGEPNQPRVITHIQEYAFQGDPKEYRIYQAVHAHKECCYYIGTESLPNGKSATEITEIDDTAYASLEELAISFSEDAVALLNQRLTHSKRKMTIIEILSWSVVGYTFLVILFTWYQGQPTRERLPSRWNANSMANKEN